MSNRSVAMPARGRRARSGVEEFLLITVLAGGAAFVSFIATAKWMPAVLAHVSAALTRAAA